MKPLVFCHNNPSNQDTVDITVIKNGEVLTGSLKTSELIGFVESRAALHVLSGPTPLRTGTAG